MSVMTFPAGGETFHHSLNLQFSRLFHYFSMKPLPHAVNSTNSDYRVSRTETHGTIEYNLRGVYSSVTCPAPSSSNMKYNIMCKYVYKFSVFSVDYSQFQSSMTKRFKFFRGGFRSGAYFYPPPLQPKLFDVIFKSRYDATSIQ